MKMSFNMLAIIAIVMAMGLVGVVAVDMILTSKTQKQKDVRIV